jgi:hypothetical protein
VGRELCVWAKHGMQLESWGEVNTKGKKIGVKLKNASISLHSLSFTLGFRVLVHGDS